MFYIRGQRHDFDDWESLGNKGWNYADVLPYFTKSENMTNPKLAATKYRGTDGYLLVSEAPYFTQMTDIFLQAGQEMGYAQTDLNGEHGIGIMRAQGTMANGRRSSTSKAFLRSVRNRKNLHIALNAHVTKILIHPFTKHAYGVEFYRDGRLNVVHVSKEVILSGGTINSPQTLMLSGIGPAEHLESLNIPVVSNLRVGDNLQDHVGVFGIRFTANIPTETNLPLTEESIALYAEHGQGPLTVPVGNEVIALMQTKFANASDDRPDVEILYGSCYGSTGPLQNAYGEFINEPLPEIERKCWLSTVFSLQPRSAGTLRLRSTDPFEHPLINAGYLVEDIDVQILIEGLKLVVATSQTSIMQKFNSTIDLGNFPACRHLETFSDDFYECLIRQYTGAFNHQVGTCKMGPASDPTAVVDEQLRVYGVYGVRVIDSSIMPSVIGGHTNAAAIMIGEKGADMVKQFWQYPTSVNL